LLRPVDFTTFSGLVITGFASGLGSAIPNYFVLGHLVKVIEKARPEEGKE
jgi:hypothetical protein